MERGNSATWSKCEFWQIISDFHHALVLTIYFVKLSDNRNNFVLGSWTRHRPVEDGTEVLDRGLKTQLVHSYAREVELEWTG